MKQLLITFLLLSQISTHSQNYVDLANVYWRFSPNNKVKGLDITRDFHMYVADVKLPLVLNDKSIFIAGLEYQQNETKSRSTLSPPAHAIKDYQFASSTLQLGLEQKWNKRSKMLFMAFGRLNTNYENISTSHFQLGGLALGTTSGSEKVDWKYGIYYNREFFPTC